MLQRCCLSCRQLTTATLIQLRSSNAVASPSSDFIPPSHVASSRRRRNVLSAYHSIARRTISISSAQPFQRGEVEECEEVENVEPVVRVHRPPAAAASTSKATLDDSSLENNRLSSRVLRPRRELLAKLKAIVHSPARAVPAEQVQATRQTAKSLGLFTDQEIVMYIALAFVFTGRCRHAVRMLREARQELRKTNRDLTADTFVFTLSGIWPASWYMDRDAWESVLGIVSLALRSLPDGKVPVDVFNARIKAWIQLKRFDQLPDALSSIPNPNRRTYNLLIKGFLLNRDQTSASSIMRTMFERGDRPDISTFRAIFTGYRNLGLHEDLYARLLSDADNLDLGSDTVILNSMISLYARAKDLWSAFEVAGRMGVEPPPSLSLESPPSWSRAARSQSMWSSNSTHNGDNKVKCDANTFAILISACARLKRPEAGLELFDELKARSAQGRRLGSAPLLANVPLAVSLLMCCLNVGDVAKADAVIDDLVVGRSLFGVPLAPGSKPNAVVFNALLSGKLRNDGFTAAPQVVKRMYEAGIWPDDRTLSIITAHLSRESAVNLRELSWAVPHIMRSLPGSVKFDVDGFNHVLARIVNDSRRIKSTADRANIRVPSNSGGGPATSDTNSGALFPTNQYLYGQRRSLLDRKNLPDASTAQALMGLHADRGGTPEALWSFLRTSTIDRGLRPTAGQITAVMRGFCDAGDPVSARTAMKLAEAFGLPPDPFFYTVLINGFVNRDDLHSAFATFAEMRRKGVAPDPFVLLCLAQGCAKDGDVRRIEELAADALSLASKGGSAVKKNGGAGTLEYFRSIVATTLYQAHMVNGNIVKAQQVIARFLEEGGTESSTGGDIVRRKRPPVSRAFAALVHRSGKQLRSFFHRAVVKRGDTEALREALRLQAENWAECKRRKAEERTRLVGTLAELYQVGGLTAHPRNRIGGGKAAGVGEESESGFRLDGLGDPPPMKRFMGKKAEARRRQQGALEDRKIDTKAE
jgi:pentatricopeptide repeat protein